MIVSPVVATGLEFGGLIIGGVNFGFRCRYFSYGHGSERGISSKIPRGSFSIPASSAGTW
jgi:hypothetical protein